MLQCTDQLKKTSDCTAVQGEVTVNMNSELHIPLKTWKEFFWLIAITSVAFSFSLAVSYSREDPLHHPAFLQSNFLVPSVFFAAGLPMGTADIESIPNLRSFIIKETACFDKNNIPPDTKIRPITTEFDAQHLYYFYAIGWMWRIFGISLHVLICYAALWQTLNAAAVYAIFRCFLKPFWAVAGTLFFITSPINFHPIIGLREHASVPFMLWVLWGITFLLRLCKSRRSYLLLTLMFGLLTGLGTGFRGDMPVYIPPVVTALLLFPDKIRGITFKTRLASLVLLALVHVLLIMPIWYALDQTHAHSFFVGISPEIEENIPFGKASYSSIPVPDPAIYGMVSTYASRLGDKDSMINENSAEYLRSQGSKDAPLLWDPFLYFNGEKYRQYTDALMLNVISYTPSDIVVRAWYGVLLLCRMPSQVLSDMKEQWGNLSNHLDKLFSLHSIVAAVQSKLGFVCTCILLLICSLKSYKRAFFWSAVLSWFSGYPTFDYEFRNYFFLAFIPTLAIFLTTGKLIASLKKLYFKRRQHTESASVNKWAQSARRPIIFICLLTFVIVAPILVLRMWQVHKIHSLARTLTEAPLQEIEISYSKEEGTCLIVPKETLPGLINAQTLPAGETAWQYVAVEVDTGGEDIPIKIQYEPLQIMYDFSQTITLFGIPDNKKGSLLFFFPVYEVDMNYGETLMASEILQMYPGIKGIVDSDLPLEEQQWWRRGKFKGISVPEDSKHAIGKMYIVSPAEELSWLPIFQLPEDSRYLRCYKTGVIEEGFRRWVRRIKKI